MKISRDTPLMELTFRRYEKPSNLQGRDLVRKFCLSIGILQPGDSRDVVVDILHTLLDAKKQKQELSSEKIKELVIEYRKENKLPMTGIASSNIRRQIKRLREIMIVEKVRSTYRISEFTDLSETFNEKVEQYLLPPIITRVKEYFSEIDKNFS